MLMITNNFNPLVCKSAHPRCAGLNILVENVTDLELPGFIVTCQSRVHSLIHCKSLLSLSAEISISSTTSRREVSSA